MIPILGEITAWGWWYVAVSGLVALIFVVKQKFSTIGRCSGRHNSIKIKRKTLIDSTILVEIEDDYVPRFPQVKLLTDKDANHKRYLSHCQKEKRLCNYEAFETQT